MVKLKSFIKARAHDHSELVRMFYPQFVSKKDIGIINSPGKTALSNQDLNQLCHLPGDADLQERGWRIKSYILNSLDMKEKMPSKFGTLIGVRPTKLITDLLDKMPPDQVPNYSKSYHSIEDLIAEFLSSTTLKEKPYFESVDPKGYSVYIHTPFCPSRCIYYSYPMIKSSNKDLLGTYVDTLSKELESYRDLSKKLTSIHISGGTPTSIEVDQLERIPKTTRKTFGQRMEFTVEIGCPNTLTEPVFSCLKSHDIQRISINP